MRGVVDANVIVSALLFTDSTPGRALSALLDHGTLLISTVLVQELNDVLGRKKFNRYVTHDERERFLQALIEESELVDITEAIAVCRDPKDNHILELAVSGHASTIVTGDRDLLDVGPFRSISIVTPQAFLESLDDSGIQP